MPSLYSLWFTAEAQSMFASAFAAHFGVILPAAVGLAYLAHAVRELWR